MSQLGTDGEPRDAVRLDTIARAIADIAAGRPVVVVDDEDRENEGDLLLAAAKATPAQLGFMVRHTSGVVCVPMEGARARPAQAAADDGGQRGPQGHRLLGLGGRARGHHDGHLGGRPAKTIRVLVDSATEPHELDPAPAMSSRSGRCQGECWCGPGTPRAAVDLARLAGLTPAGVIAES
jgi:3,4-dihydroxy 2-butanone 4-phosphate synthase/GTP cyclohydrolase II